MSATDPRARWREANDALSRKDYEQAVKLLLGLASRNHVPKAEMKTYARGLAQGYRGLGMGRAASAVLAFLGELQDAARLVRDETDIARIRRAEGNLSAAARAYEIAGFLGHAALMLDDAGDTIRARVLWERLAKDPRLSDDPYTKGLVCFDLSRACAKLGDDKAARRHMVQSVHLIEAAADGFEAIGLRERAFDCFQVLLSLGKDGAFENLAEGYVNCIRILGEDELKYYVLQYFEDFQAIAMDRGEYLAAATLYREAADFARKYAMPYEQTYRLLAAEAQISAAESAAAAGLVEMAENGRAAAIDALAEVGAFARVRAQYDAMAALPLPDKRRERYARLARRLSGASDAAVTRATLPGHLRMSAAYPEIWRLDVIAWEQAGDAAEVMGETLLSPDYADFTARRALVCRLFALSHATSMSTDERKTLADLLGQVELYVCLDPLEYLARDPAPEVRAAVMAAMKKLFFKRSFPLIARGLRDDAPEVRRAAIAAVETLHFPHALDPLRRILRQSSDADVRRAALGSIGRVQSPEAVELLLEALENGTPAESASAQDLLVRADQTQADEIILRAARDTREGAARARLEKVLRARGLSL